MPRRERFHQALLTPEQRIGIEVVAIERGKHARSLRCRNGDFPEKVLIGRVGGRLRVEHVAMRSEVPSTLIALVSRANCVSRLLAEMTCMCAHNRAQRFDLRLIDACQLEML